MPSLVGSEMCIRDRSYWATDWLCQDQPGRRSWIAFTSRTPESRKPWNWLANFTSGHTCLTTFHRKSPDAQRASHNCRLCLTNPSPLTLPPSPCKRSPLICSTSTRPRSLSWLTDTAVFLGYNVCGRPPPRSFVESSCPGFAISVSLVKSNLTEDPSSVALLASFAPSTTSATKSRAHTIPGATVWRKRLSSP